MHKTQRQFAYDVSDTYKDLRKFEDLYQWS